MIYERFSVSFDKVLIAFFTVYSVCFSPLALANDYWSAASASNKSTGLDPTSVCGLLSLPGDFRVTTGYYTGDPSKLSSRIEYHLIDPFGVAGEVVDALGGHNPYQRYSHSGLVTGVRSDMEPIMSSWFDHRYAGIGAHGYQNYGIYRVAGGLKINEKAMQNARVLTPGGVCADGVDAMYDHALSESQQRNPGIILIESYSPLATLINEKTNTPTRLTESPLAERICEVVNFKLVYPKSIQTAELLKLSLEAKNSSESVIAGHANEVLNFLEEEHYIAGDQVIINSISFSDLLQDRYFGDMGIH